MQIISRTLAEQFDRVFATFRDALAKFPDEQLTTSDVAWFAPARQAFHIIDNLSFYVDSDPDSFRWGRIAKTWARCAAEELPRREEILRTLAAVEQKTRAWLSNFDDDAWLAGQEKMDWVGKTTLDRALYALRHTQHHVAHLNAELRRRGLPRGEWR